MATSYPGDDDGTDPNSRALARRGEADLSSLDRPGKMDAFQLGTMSHRIVAQTNQLPVPQRKATRHAFRNLASRLKEESANNSGNATIASGLGFLGGSLLVGAVLVSGPISLPLVAIGGFGAIGLIGGLATSAILSRQANRQTSEASLIENIISEIEL